jgi:Flp pilus assembly protein TadG
MNLIRRLIAAREGAGAAEFAMVVPLAILFLFGIIDVGRFMWEYNRAELATQLGARYAVVTAMVPATLASQSFVSGTVTQGDPIPTSAFSTTRCTNVSPCSNSWGYNATAFANIVARMRVIYPTLTAANVVIDYDNVGLGYAGNPDSTMPDVAPLVTVRLRNLTFRPLLLTFFGGTVTMPDFWTALTLEDGSGDRSN